MAPLVSWALSRDKIIEISGRLTQDAQQTGDSRRDERTVAGEQDTFTALICAHAHAVRKCLFSAFSRAGLGDDVALTQELNRLRGMERLAFTLGHRLGGDTMGGVGGPDELIESLTAAARVHLAAEEDLVEELSKRISAERMSELDRDFRAALRRSPTRAHPHAPNGHLGRPVRAFLVRWDALLDTVNSRSGHGWIDDEKLARDRIRRARRHQRLRLDEGARRRDESGLD